uniref:Transmembrane protein n=1 Tax=Cacopsylla melanoneura TaxID=428564 RepID=A0A8D8UGV4_9HEMI
MELIQLPSLRDALTLFFRLCFRSFLVFVSLGTSNLFKAKFRLMQNNLQKVFQSARKHVTNSGFPPTSKSQGVRKTLSLSLSFALFRSLSLSFTLSLSLSLFRSLSLSFVPIVQPSLFFISIFCFLSSLAFLFFFFSSNNLRKIQYSFSTYYWSEKFSTQFVFQLETLLTSRPEDPLVARRGTS